MKIIYMANMRLPTDKAHGIQIMEMCQSFARLGNEVELIIPRRKNFIKDDPFDYYGIKKIFSIKYLPSLNFMSLGKIGYSLGLLTFTLSLVTFCLFRKSLFYTREGLPALVLVLLGKKVIWEGHRGEVGLSVRWLIFFKIKMVVITKSLKDLYINVGAKDENILVSPDGVDIERFVNIQMREKYSEKVVLYTGHLYDWKGVDTLAQAAKLLAEDIGVYFIGGTDGHIKRFKERYSGIKNIKILGRKPHQEIPSYLASADILVLPNSAKDDISRLYTSPIKLFEYMASGKPIVASELPSIREILDESMAYFFTPDDPQSLAKVINYALIDADIPKMKGKKAQEISKNYSWDKRAEKITKFI